MAAAQTQIHRHLTMLTHQATNDDHVRETILWTSPSFSTSSTNPRGTTIQGMKGEMRREPRSPRRMQALPSPTNRSVTRSPASIAAMADRVVVEAMPAIQFYLSLLQRQVPSQFSAQQTLRTHDPEGTGRESRLARMITEETRRVERMPKYDDGTSPHGNSNSSPAAVTWTGADAPTHAQHGEQLRMRGIQPSRRSNEIHVHIAPAMDTSVKHVIAQ